jgi:hypothetical protein
MPRTEGRPKRTRQHVDRRAGVIVRSPAKGQAVFAFDSLVEGFRCWREDELAAHLGNQAEVGIEVGGLLRRAEKPAVGNEGPLTGEG